MDCAESTLNRFVTEELEVKHIGCNSNLFTKVCVQPHINLLLIMTSIHTKLVIRQLCEVPRLLMTDS